MTRDNVDQSTPLEAQTDARIVVAGSLAVDYSCDYSPLNSHSPPSPTLRTSNPAKISHSLGGVAHNVARACQLAGGAVRLCSLVGKDLTGVMALEALSIEGLGSGGIKTIPGGRTAQYVAINDHAKDLVIAMADMDILDSISKGPDQSKDGSLSRVFDDFWKPQLEASRPSHVVLDANWSSDMLRKWTKASNNISARLYYEPVSTAKCGRILDSAASTSACVFPTPIAHLAAPNMMELSSMHAHARSLGMFDRGDWWNVLDAFGIPSTGARVQLAVATSPALVDAGIPQQAIQLLPFIPCLPIKLGSSGVLLTQVLKAGDERLQNGNYAPYILSRCTNGSEGTLGVGGLYMRLFPPQKVMASSDMISVNGAGDTFLGVLIAALDARGSHARVEDAIDIAQTAAMLTLKSDQAVSPDIESLRESVRGP